MKAFVNDGEARYYGVDALVSYSFSTRWFAEGNYSYLVGHDLNPTRPVRRLPPQQGYVSIRYQPAGRISMGRRQRLYRWTAVQPQRRRSHGRAHRRGTAEK